jgi:hypothetical protein
MNKKYLIVAICLVVICLFISLFIVNKHNKNVTVNLNKNEVQRIHISYSMPLFDQFDITDTKQVYMIVDYLNSLNKKNTKKNPGEYLGGGYTIKIYLKNGIERTLFLTGNMFFSEINRFTYEIPYREAIKFDTIVASILEGNKSRKGESSIIGTVISLDAEQSGRDISCIIKTEGNINYNIDLKDTKIIDATGAGNLLIHKEDKIKVFYPKEGQTENVIIHASMVFIESSSR